MEATLCQAVENNSAEIAVEDQQFTTLTSAEMSYAGGGLMAVAFG